MTIPEAMQLMVVIFIVIPALAFLIVKYGTVGFYRGKEVYKKLNGHSEFQNENEESEH